MFSSLSSPPRVGRVKWFNARHNYGFLVDVRTGAEIFVHVSDLRPKNADPTLQKTLYTGEYVEFDVSPSHVAGREKAANVRGMMSHEPFGGNLLCEMGQLRFTQYSRVQFQASQGTTQGTDGKKMSSTSEPTGPDCV